MPSTYSNLKIQLMATGENTATWGNVTNLNLGTAIEEAIVGSADVTFASNNQTLTLADSNSSQTARNMRLRCTGTTGGSTRNLVVPSIEKPYIIKNDCADSVVVKTSAGTGITVPAGKTMWVYSDGTNVVDVVTHLTSLTTPDLTATNLTATNLTSTNLAASNTVTDTGTIAADSLGFRGLPQNAQTGAYTLALADAGKHVSNTTGGFAIPANGSVAFPIGTAIVVYNDSASTQSITITTDTLRLAGTTSTGTRTLAVRGLATLVKVKSTEWVVSGNVT